MAIQNTPARIIIHHTANASQAPQFEATNEYHRTKFAWVSSLGYYVAYHRFIERDGTTYIARQDTEGGPHTLGYNYSGLAVCMAGDFTTQRPTSQQIAALQRVMEEWRTKYAIPYSEINPHRHYNPSTECYGANLPDAWAKYEAMLYRLGVLRGIAQTILNTLTR